MPECWDDMLQCELCEEWLHMTYEGLKTAPEGEWLCTVCRPPKLKRVRINVASHQNKKGFALSFNSLNSIVILLSFNSCVGYSTNLNKCHRNETIRALFFIVYDLVLKS